MLFRSLGPEKQRAFLALEARIPGGSTALDLAWFACDGKRGVGTISTLLRREGHDVDEHDLETWFDTLAELSLIEWRP